ncbi:3' terminal RNA ribose 2'-O-methyltransferase Hen1 [Leptolyngbya sp. AN03gr2]|uniref:3' terminal RNA ribose 2'-O-methyltransferase Hen1 n=1 Tax=unclassified Leptolyngbya TaxID=2650499 RepID=UPI003D313AEC
MLLTITTAHSPATDLGYLLGKHPDRFQPFELSFGRAQVFYPIATPECCTVALLLEVDPVRLVRGQATTLEQYVNDRPYVASSFLSVAIAQVFRSALSGQCKDRPDLATQKIPLQAKISVLPCRGGKGFLQRLFEPLGYRVNPVQHPLDEQFSEWGNSAYYSVELTATTTLSALLSHLYVLIPVLDEDKHYWVGEEEVEKLLRHGQGWLSEHPEKTQIAQRYLKRRRSLTQAALAQLETEEDTESETEIAIEKPISLNQIRYETIAAQLKQCQAKRVIDLGCGEGKLIMQLAKDSFFEQISGMDVSSRSLSIVQEKLERLPTAQKHRVQVFQGALTYRDRRFENYDAATLIEVIEHLDESRLAALERVVFEFAHPSIVLVTTPNREYNIKFENLAIGKFRHSDHRFEWTRKEFQTWATQIAQRFDYTVSFADIGASDPIVGAPTQLAIFERSDR